MSQRTIGQRASAEEEEEQTTMSDVDPLTGPLVPGDEFLQKYTIRGFLGKGGHGFVYRAHHAFLNRDIAIKIIVKPVDPARDLRGRAQREAQFLCALKHPNVVSVMDGGLTDDGFVYILMELLQGCSLREVLVGHGRLSVTEALTIGAQVADGVQAAHAAGAIHRDLKPDNVYIIENNVAKVLDFGIAKFVDAKTTQRDHLDGTVPYMSPEHLRGLGVTPKSDIFSLGTLLYEALAGTPPCLIGLKERTWDAIGMAQIHQMPPPVDRLIRTVPRHTARIVQRMIAKNPADRFATMGEAAAALRASLERARSSRGAGNSPARELWKKRESPASSGSGPAGSAPSPTAKFGLAQPFGSTAVMPRPQAQALHRALPAAEAAPELTSGQVTVNLNARQMAPSISVATATTRRLVPWLTVRRVLAVALTLGAMTGLALGLLLPPQRAVVPAGPTPTTARPAPPSSPPMGEPGRTPEPVLTPSVEMNEPAIPAPSLRTPSFPVVASPPPSTGRANKSPEQRSNLPRRVPPDLTRPLDDSAASERNPGDNRDARPVSRPVRRPTPSPPKPMYGAEDIE